MIVRADIPVEEEAHIMVQKACSFRELRSIRKLEQRGYERD